MNSPTPVNRNGRQRWQALISASTRAFHAYANWLISISWRRFIFLALALLVLMAILHDLPPFTWRVSETVEARAPRVVILPQRKPAPPRAPQPPAPPQPAEHPDHGVQINIGKEGIRIVPRAPAQAAASAAAAAAQAEQAAASAAAAATRELEIKLPPGPASDAVREALRQAREQIQETVADARRDAEEAARDAAEARRDAEKAIEEVTKAYKEGPRTRTRRVGIGDLMMQLTLFWIIASLVIKATYKGRVQAEVKAAQATETAEAESLRRQVVEARMAAMQAQVEPHFLFNTLASIDHLIETDPPRASQMQKNLIALLRASMPSMREASGNGHSGVRELGRELAVIRPYLEILKVRMEERLNTEIAVPDGLLSAEFPPMMIQTLVENAIKHGLEPKPEGGTLSLKAEIVHGKLQVTVADTGLGFGAAATGGTGVGLVNIRERLQLLYGPKATLSVASNQPSGTVATITVPYRTIEGAFA